MNACRRTGDFWNWHDSINPRPNESLLGLTKNLAQCLYYYYYYFFKTQSKIQRETGYVGRRLRNRAVHGQTNADLHPAWHINVKIHTLTKWMPVNTNKSSSSSWNSPMKQLWVPAEPDSPTHWASYKQTYTHALTQWYTYHTQNLAHALYVLTLLRLYCRAQ